MKKSLEIKLREAFKAGALSGAHQSYFDRPLDEDEYIESLKPKVEEERIPITYGSIRRVLNWEKFCDLTGTSYFAKREGFSVENDEVFYILKSKAKDYGLI